MLSLLYLAFYLRMQAALVAECEQLKKVKEFYLGVLLGVSFDSWLLCVVLIQIVTEAFR